MLNTPLLIRELLYAPMLTNVLYIEPLLLCAELSPPSIPLLPSMQVQFYIFIKTDIVCNYTTKITLSMVHGDRNKQLNYRSISDSAS